MKAFQYIISIVLPGFKNLDINYYRVIIMWSDTFFIFCREKTSLGSLGKTHVRLVK
jgi:hypothetical protein